MNSYQVKLEFFEGPLDLLLYLIKRDDMDIQDIRISVITEEYLKYIDLIKDLNLEMAGEFLVMASTLMQIKARSLLPSDELNGLEDEGPDPRAELIAKLLEYQKFKEASKILLERQLQYKDVYYRDTPPVFTEEDMFLDATLFDLLGAFRQVLLKAPQEIKEFLYEEIPMEQKMREILDFLEAAEPVHFLEIFSRSRSRREIIVTFLAILELIRLKQIHAKQTEYFGEIRIYRLRDTNNSNLDGLDSGFRRNDNMDGEESHGEREA